jgi:hypothetical protein
VWINEHSKDDEGKGFEEEKKIPEPWDEFQKRLTNS